MKEIIINDDFNNKYLTLGNLDANYVFHSCPVEFMRNVKKNLTSNTNVKSCIVKITRDDGIMVEQTLDNFYYDMQRDIIASDYVCSLILLQLLKDEAGNTAEKRFLRNGIYAIKNNNYMRAQDYNRNSPKTYTIESYAKKHGKIELNFFLIGTKTKYLQRIINTFISPDMPFHVRIFTDQKCLTTYLNEFNDFIISPKDYIDVDINNFIEVVDSKEVR